jgi:hypothetical protein
MLPCGLIPQPPGSITRKFAAQVRRRAGIRRSAGRLTASDEVGIEPVCPVGTVWNGQECAGEVGILPFCEEGSVWDGAECKPLCPEGTYFDAGQCLPQDIDVSPCPEGTVWNGSVCVPPDFENMCPIGSVFDGQQCVPSETLPPVCPEGFMLVDNECVANPVVCPRGTRATAGGCVTECSGNRVWDADSMSCVCMPGYIVSVDNPETCVPIDVGICPEGHVWSPEAKACVPEGKEENGEDEEVPQSGPHCDEPQWYCMSQDRFNQCGHSDWEGKCQALNAGWDRECERRGPPFWCKPGKFEQCVTRLGFEGAMADFSACKARLGRRCKKCGKTVTNIYNINACPGH